MAVISTPEVPINVCVLLFCVTLNTTIPELSSALSEKLAEFGVVESILALKFVGTSVSGSLSMGSPYTSTSNKL